MKHGWVVVDPETFGREFIGLYLGEKEAPALFYLHLHYLP
jgi:hypothetical protein